MVANNCSLLMDQTVRSKCLIYIHSRSKMLSNLSRMKELDAQLLLMISKQTDLRSTYSLDVLMAIFLD